MEKREFLEWAKQWCRETAGLGIPMHAAGAGYFIILSIFPMLVLLLGLLRYTGLSVDAFNAFMEGIIPGALMPSARILSYFTQTDVPKSLMQVYPTHIQADANFKVNFNLVFKVPLPL